MFEREAEVTNLIKIHFQGLYYCERCNRNHLLDSWTGSMHLFTHSGDPRMLLLSCFPRTVTLNDIQFLKPVPRGFRKMDKLDLLRLAKDRKIIDAKP